MCPGADLLVLLVLVERPRVGDVKQFLKVEVAR